MLLNLRTDQEIEEFDVHISGPWISEPSEKQDVNKNIEKIKSGAISNILVELIKRLELL